ncbi:MAG: type II secretion system protein [Planctomycetota bacterium]
MHSRRRNRKHHTRAFTLIELLVVISIISLLMGILLPSLSGARQSAWRVVCASNMRQIGVATQTYALNNKREIYLPSLIGVEDNIGWLFPDFVDTPEVAICPATDHVVRTDFNLSDFPLLNGLEAMYTRDFLADLYLRQDDKTDSPGGHSAEPFPWLDEGVYPDGQRINSGGTIATENGWEVDLASFASLLDAPAPGQLKTARSVAFPSRTIIVGEADHDEADAIAIASVGIGNPDGVNSFPNEWNNHGELGTNFTYLDGSARWAPSQDIVDIYMQSAFDFVGWQDPSQPRRQLLTRAGYTLGTTVSRGKSIGLYERQ